MRRVQIPLRHFFATPPTPCPYLPDRMERKVVTLLSCEEPDQLHSVLSKAGFRRSQDLAYRPACDECNACVPVRIPAERFRPNRSQRRTWRRNGDLTTNIMPAVAQRDHYRLFRQYVQSRHATGDMTEMRQDDYRAMVEDTPVDSFLVEFRDPEERLLAVCLSDRMTDGLSMVYSFFDPQKSARSLGTHVVQWHVAHALREGLANVYLGYWIEESRKMAYKSDFKPLEYLTPEGWADEMITADAGAGAESGASAGVGAGAEDQDRDKKPG